MDFDDLLAPATDNPSGTKPYFYIAALSTFDSIQAATGLSAASLAEVADISTDHTFTTGNNFHKVEAEVNKNNVGDEYQGNVRGNRSKHIYTAFLPNISAAQLGLVRAMQAEKSIVLVPLADGKYLQLGEENNGATVKGSFASGEDEGGERGYTLTIEWFGYAQLYSGTVTTTPAA